jgi:cytochrome c peroxidase
MRIGSCLRLLAVALAAGWLAACGGGTGRGGTSAPLSSAARLGERLFNDTALSASGQQACASCHVARFAFAGNPGPDGPDHGLPAPLGGPGMDRPGFRNTPSLKYASYTPAFHFEADGTPAGGFFRDGRAASLAEQAQQPFLTPFEMANADASAVLDKLKRRPYFGDFVALYGAQAGRDPQVALARIGAALAAYQTEDEDFHPFSSKYDYWRRGQAALSAQELEGLRLFNDPAKGNCAACHPSTSADGRTPPLFTDFTYDNLGLPRNLAIAANRDEDAPDYTPANAQDGVHRYYDLGLCGPLRTDLAQRGDLCGAFKVPTLRNVALTAPYFHNGAFATLAEAVAFYVRRDTDPAQWYPAAQSATQIVKFDDLPAAFGGQFVIDLARPGSDAGYRGNVNTAEVPYNRRLGEPPALSAEEIVEVVAFLCTLTDGYDPDHPADYATLLPTQCPQSAAHSTLKQGTSP